jgi:hypothetical protein
MEGVLFLFFILAAIKAAECSLPGGAFRTWPQMPPGPYPNLGTPPIPPNPLDPNNQGGMPTAQTTPSPWPQAVPAGLPPFPSGWEFAEPPSKAIQARAWALLHDLWARGEGSTQQEQTEGQWITYRSEITRGNKHGVVAYRIRTSATARPTPPQVATRPPAPAPAPAPAPSMIPHPSQTSMPAPAPAAPILTSTFPPPPSAPNAPAVVHPVTTAGKPVLHQGAGMGALTALAPYVVDAQQKLRITADGKFGAGTAAAVHSFQAANGLSPDGVIGEHTWAALDAVPAALAYAS